MNGGIKHDAGKDPWQLLPWDALRVITYILRYGADKYEPRNWERGMDYDRLFRAAIEHLVSWWERDDKGRGPGMDPETGYSHLWHAACCVLFLITYEIRGVGTDNRPAHREGTTNA